HSFHIGSGDISPSSDKNTDNLLTLLCCKLPPGRGDASVASVRYAYLQQSTNRFCAEGLGHRSWQMSPQAAVVFPLIYHYMRYATALTWAICVRIGLERGRNVRRTGRMGYSEPLREPQRTG